MYYIELMRMRSVYEQILMTFILFLCCISISQGQTANEVAKKTLPSVVVLFNVNSKGKTVSLGSGFYVRNNVIATNYHVVKGASRVYAKQINQPRLYPIKKILAYDSIRDIALLRISGVEGSPLWLGNSCKLEIGDAVYVVGNPKGLEGTFSQGIISSIRNLNGKRYLQITAAISEGSSGGPILNEEGEVVGIAVATLKEGQNLNFAVSGQDLAAIIYKTIGEGFGVDMWADVAKCIK